ncbi:MAG TPA: type II toxin-antitoxin system VapB family antitoxin [Chloroflexota bacterium]|nr:type II toxin-antitoxin system VapB family antitoxin [Chloroflexota bacterium]
MSLNIKREETYRLARELADLTGESVTVAVTESARPCAAGTGADLSRASA